MSLLTLLLLVGCGQFESRYRQTSPDLVYGVWDDKLAEGREYSGYTLEALEKYGASLTAGEPADIDTFCPGYRTRDQIGRRGFWLGLISAMAKSESNFRTESFYREKFESQGLPVISRGLLQMSLDSTRSYNCGFSNGGELHDPRRNIECGVRILSRLVARDALISGRRETGEALGASRYWAVLRTGHEALNKIQLLTRALPVCEL